MASYSLVKSYGDPDRRPGRAVPRHPLGPDPGQYAYPGLPWQPKESFHAVASYYDEKP
jgi:hypothetical protein